MDISKMTKAQLIALLNVAASPVPPAIAAAPQPEVASLAIPDAAWETLEAAVIGSFDTPTRDRTFLGVVLSFAQQVPADWRGKALPEGVVDAHADNVKAKLKASYGDITKLSKDDQDRITKTCDQKRARAKALFTCSTILAQAYEQGFKGGVVEAGKLCTELAKASYNLKAVMDAREAAKSAPRDWAKDVAGCVDQILNMKPEGTAVPLCLNTKSKAQFVMLAEALGLALKHGNAHRNNPLALS